MANTPTLKVEIAFDDDPLTVSPTWTDVTSSVRDGSVRISRGRPTELDTFTAGQCSFTLDNRDGEFSPLNSGSTYNGKLLPGKQVRVTATYSSTDYRLFRGFITGWPQRYAQGKKDAIVPIVAYDAFARLNETDLADPMLAYLESATGLTSLWRNLDGNQWLDVVSGRAAVRQRGTVVAASSLAAGLDDTGVSLTSGRLRIPLGAYASADHSYSMWVQTSSAGASTSSFMAMLTGPNVGLSERFVIGIDSNGLVRYRNVDVIPGFPATAQSKDPINDGQPHHVVVANGTNVRIYIDGVDNTNLVTGLNEWPGYASLENYIGANGSLVDSDFTGTLQDIAVFDGLELSGAQVRRIYELGVGAYSRSTATALGELLDSAGWPSALRSIATNTTGQCVASWLEGDSAGNVAQTIAATEQGRFFVSGSGNVTLLARYSHQLDTTGNTSQHTFSDDGADSDYVDVGYNYDDVQVRNSIAVSGAGVSGAAEDAASITAYGQQSGSVTTYLASANECEQMAYGLVGWRKDPQLRSLPLSSVPQVDPAQWPSILALELGQRVTFEITPPGVGSQVATQLILEQMDWDITNALWELTVQASPIPPDVFILDSSLLDGTDVLGV